MDIKVRLLRRSDIAQVVSGWNKCLHYDRLTEEMFESTIFDDPNYEKEGNFVATRNDRIVGFVAAVAREGIAGRDGAGRAHERDFGYIKGLFVLKKYDEKEDTKRYVLERASKFLKSKGKKMARVVKYTGRYFFPGIDARYEEELRFYRENGFEEIDAEEDVTVDLNAFQPTEYQRKAGQQIEKLGIIIKPYQPGFLNEMRRFADKLSYPQWFPKGWESNFAKKGYTIVALLGTEVVGWATFGRSRTSKEWYFGPIAVLEEFGRRGIGSCLLLESMLRMKALGASNVTAGWANVPFYLKNDWIVSRRYVVFQKEIADMQ
ncbi:MAG: GNAT family N-acetyltransferase [Candidatus Bathyarchaeota archaeon]